MTSTVPHARITVRLSTPGRRLSRETVVTADADGSARATLPLGLARGRIQARAVLTAGGATVTDRAGIITAPLTIALARANAQRFAMASDLSPYPTTCHRFSAVRVDCALAFRQLSAARQCPGSVQMLLRDDGFIDTRLAGCGSKAFPYVRKLATLEEHARIMPVLLSTYDVAFIERRECLGPHDAQIHASNCRHGFGPGVRLGRIERPSQRPRTSPRPSGRPFTGRTSQGEVIRFTLHPTARTITDINTVLHFRCDAGQQTVAAYGGFDVSVRRDKTFATTTSHGHFRGHFVSARRATGDIRLKLQAGEPSGCDSGLVRFAVHRQTRSRHP
jgi:hypothetical protein